MYVFIFILFIYSGEQTGARWLRGQSARPTIAEAKQRSQKVVIGWVAKIHYIELLRVKAR
jgi:hypothetical protein